MEYPRKTTPLRFSDFDDEADLERFTMNLHDVRFRLIDPVARKQHIHVRVYAELVKNYGPDATAEAFAANHARSLGREVVS